MWGGTSSLPVRFVLSVLERGINDKGEFSAYCWGYASPSNTIKSSFLSNKPVFQCCLCHPDKGLHIPPLPVPTEHLCLYIVVLQDTVEGAQRGTAPLLLFMTVTCDRHWVLLRDCLVPHPLGGHSHGSLNTPSPPLRAQHSHKTAQLSCVPRDNLTEMDTGQKCRINSLGEGRLWYRVESLVLGMVPLCRARRFVWLWMNCQGLWLSAASSALGSKIKWVHSNSGC